MVWPWALVHWSVGGLNIVAVDWQHLRDAPGIADFARAVEMAPRRRSGRGTAIGAAIDFSTRLIESNRFAGDGRKIDISGDSRSNSGASPHFARDRAVQKGITINGLILPGGDRELRGYFEVFVTGGADSFVLVADHHADFADAMRRKLARELNWKLSRAAPVITSD